MPAAPPNLPEDKDTLKALVAALMRERDNLHIANLRLQVELDSRPIPTTFRLIPSYKKNCEESSAVRGVVSWPTSKISLSPRTYTS